MTERGGAVHIPMVSEDGALVKDNLLQQLDQFVGKVSRHECLDGDRDVIWVGRLVESSLDHLWRRHTLPSKSESMVSLGICMSDMYVNVCPHQPRSSSTLHHTNSLLLYVYTIYINLVLSTQTPV